MNALFGYIYLSMCVCVCVCVCVYLAYSHTQVLLHHTECCSYFRIDDLVPNKESQQRSINDEYNMS